MRTEEIRRSSGICLMDAHARGQRFQPACDQPRSERVQRSALVHQDPAQLGEALMIAHYNRAAERIAVPADVFGQRMDNIVRPERDGLSGDWRGDG